MIGSCMSNVEKYLNKVIQYYSSAQRPYRDVGFPQFAFRALRPSRVLETQSKTIIVGPPGSGKTTFLDWTALTAATERSWIPIFVSLRNYASTLHDLLQISIERFIDFNDVASLLNQNNEGLSPVFLLDGIDEVPKTSIPKLEKEIFDLTKLWPNSPFLVTSRLGITEPQWTRWDRLEIPALSYSQIKEFLSDLPRGCELWGLLSENKNLLKLTNRPIFLHTIRNAWLHGDDFRSILMKEIPRYTVWRGHTKSLLPTSVLPSDINAVLEIFALNLATRNEQTANINRLESFVVEVADNREIVAALLDAVLSTDVIVQTQPGKISFSHLTLLESYAARSIASHLKFNKSIESILQAVLSSNFSEGIVNVLLNLLSDDELEQLSDRLKSETYSHLIQIGRVSIADRNIGFPDKEKDDSIQMLRALHSTTEYVSQQEKKRTPILVIAVHGFNTRGDWKNELGLVLTRTNAENQLIENFIYRAWDYGVFRLGILNPIARCRQVEKFQSFFNDLIGGFSTRPEICIVAHSFGTYIVGHALQRFPELSFDRLLLLGSALPRSFDWKGTNSRCGKILNFIGGADSALFFARFVWGLGDAGKKGFKGGVDEMSQVRASYSDHGDLFGKEFMKNAWLPFISGGKIP